MTTPDLTPAQSEFVSEILHGAPGWVVLEGPLGSGKTTALHSAISQSASSGWSVLVASPYAMDLDQMALQLSDRAPGTLVEVLTKDRFREMASLGGLGPGAAPGVYLTLVGLLAHRDVSTALSRMEWDLVAVEDGLAGEGASSVVVEAQDESASICVEGGEPISARRIATVAYDSGSAGSGGGRRIRLGGTKRRQAEARRGVLSYAWTAEEARLLADLERTFVEADLPEPVAAALRLAAESSFPALARTLIDLVNGVESGASDWLSPGALVTVEISGVGGSAWGAAAFAAIPFAAGLLGPVGIAAGGAYAVLRARRAQAADQARRAQADRDVKSVQAAVQANIKRAIALSNQVDGLPSDSKLDRLIHALADGEIGGSAVVFADHPETFDYLAIMLEDVVSVHTLRADEKDAAARQATLESFHKGGLLLAQTLPMRGLEVSASDVIHYDVPPGSDRLALRETRVQGGGNDLRVWRFEPET